MKIFIFALTALLVSLKLIGMIECSWLVLFSPIYISLVIYLIFKMYNKYSNREIYIKDE